MLDRRKIRWTHLVQRRLGLIDPCAVLAILLAEFDDLLEDLDGCVLFRIELWVEILLQRLPIRIEKLVRRVGG